MGCRMKKSTVLMIIWGLVIVVLIAFLTTLGFLVGKRSMNYKKLEDKISLAVKESSIDLNLLTNNEMIINKEDIIKQDILKEEDFVLKNDVCDAYVKITYDSKYNYKTYLKCKKYET